MPFCCSYQPVCPMPGNLCKQQRIQDTRLLGGGHAFSLLRHSPAGEQGITVKYQLDPLTRKIIDGSKQLPFMGAGGSGTKTYTLDC